MKKRINWVTAVTGAALLYLILSGNRGLWNLYKLHQEKQNLSGQVEQLKSEIGRYQVEYQDFQRNPSVLEKQAREELNLVKPGEVVYKFTKADHP